MISVLFGTIKLMSALSETFFNHSKSVECHVLDTLTCREANCRSWYCRFLDIRTQFWAAIGLSLEEN